MLAGSTSTPRAPDRSAATESAIRGGQRGIRHLGCIGGRWHVDARIWRCLGCCAVPALGTVSRHSDWAAQAPPLRFRLPSSASDAGKPTSRQHRLAARAQARSVVGGLRVGVVQLPSGAGASTISLGKSGAVCGQLCRQPLMRRLRAAGSSGGHARRPVQRTHHRYTRNVTLHHVPCPDSAADQQRQRHDRAQTLRDAGQARGGATARRTPRGAARLRDRDDRDRPRRVRRRVLRGGPGRAPMMSHPRGATCAAHG